MGTAKFINTSILIKQLPTVTCGEGCVVTAKGVSYVTKKGGAIYNKVCRENQNVTVNDPP